MCVGARFTKSFTYNPARPKPLLALLGTPNMTSGVTYYLDFHNAISFFNH